MKKNESMTTVVFDIVEIICHCFIHVFLNSRIDGMGERMANFYFFNWNIDFPEIF